jgi:hypothetical protein
VFAYVAAATGWTWEYIGECLTLPRLAALQKHWRDFPPVHIMVAAYAGYKPKAEATAPNGNVLTDAQAEATKAKAWSSTLPMYRVPRPS